MSEPSGQQVIIIPPRSAHSKPFALGGVALAQLYIPAGLVGLLAFGHSASGDPGEHFGLIHRIGSLGQMEVVHITPAGMSGWVSLPPVLLGSLWIRIVTYRSDTFTDDNLQPQSDLREFRLTYTKFVSR